jgi:hypothetical protein
MAAANAKTAPIKTSGHGEPGSTIPPSVMAVVDVSMCVSSGAADPHNSADFHGDIMWFTPQEREALEE